MTVALAVAEFKKVDKLLEVVGDRRVRKVSVMDLTSIYNDDEDDHFGGGIDV